MGILRSFLVVVMSRMGLDGRRGRRVSQEQVQEAWCGRSIRREDCAVAAGKECGCYLGRGRGLCEGFKRGNDRVRL